MKQQLGQFFTTNSDYILQGLEIFIKDKEICDPFAGSKDLIIWAQKNKCKNIIGFDIDKQYIDNKIVFQNDSLNNPKEYKFILTNPPYLHKNKADKVTKSLFFQGKYTQFEDLYQAAIFSMLKSEEGILIVPLNFLSADNSRKIREYFFNKFEIVKLNIFSQKVFSDTTYNVISFYYRQKNANILKNNFSAVIFPEVREVDFTIEKRFGWRLGGDFFEKIKQVKNYLQIFRLTEDFLQEGASETKIAIQDFKNIKKANIKPELKKKIQNNVLLLRAIDSKNGKKIRLENIRQYGVSGLAGKSTSRNLAHLMFGKEVSIQDQEALKNAFNNELDKNREKYFSFFLTNFRDNNRKRISFNFAYKLLNYLYLQKNEKQPALF